MTSVWRFLLAVLSLAALAIVPGLTPHRARADVPVVAAASGLQFALPEIAQAFTRDTGHVVRLSFGSTGNFARQIRQGAPFDILLAADEISVADLYRDGFTRDAGHAFALGRLAIMVPIGSTLSPDGSLEDLAQKLAAGQVSRFAIANPDHAPYGMRAREVLSHRGLWGAVQDALVIGENVAQAAQFVASGNADGGIVAYSLALAPNVAARVHVALIPRDWHHPLQQSMVLLNTAGPVAEAFYAYLRSPPARDIMMRYGFEWPEGG